MWRRGQFGFDCNGLEINWSEKDSIIVGIAI
jgi:hypothetical protein